MLSGTWQQPTHLWCNRDNDGGSVRQAGQLVGQGPLEAMVRRAAEIAPSQQQLLMLELDSTHELLAWNEIDSLRNASDFPVEI